MAKLIKIGDGLIGEFTHIMAISFNEDGTFKSVDGHRPIIGCSLRVENTSTYWMTTLITEIIEERKDYVLFKTENSTYELIEFENNI